MKKRYNKIDSCARCGLKRVVRKGAGVLCRDCRYVMTEEEMKLWNDPALT